MFNDGWGGLGRLPKREFGFALQINPDGLLDGW
jgi:hypothetical protein